MNNANLIISSKSISLAGTVLFNIAINLWVISELGGTSELGKVISIAGISTLLFNLIGGYVADLWSREKILKYVDLFSGLVCFLSIFIFKEPNLWTIMVVVFLLNMNNAISAPVIRSIIPQLVEKEILIKYNSKLSQITEMVKITIPYVTTLSFGRGIIDINDVFIINGLSFFISFILINKVGILVKDKNKKNEGANYFAVLAFLKKNSIITMLMITSLFSNFILVGFNLILPVYAIKVLNNKEFYGIFIGAESLGTLFGVFSSKLLSIDKNMIKERIGLFLAGLLLLLPYFFQNFIVVIIVCFMLNLFLSRYNIAFQSYIQMNVPTIIMGKTFSLVFLFAGIATPLGALFFGYIGNFWILEIFIILALGIMIINGAWIIFIKKAENYLLKKPA